jgi:cobalt/nickel transport system permease protein
MLHVSTFDRSTDGQSLLHRLDPRVKVVVTVLFIVSNALLPDGAWLALALAWGLVLAGNLLAGLGPGYTLARSFVALPFALAASSAVFALPGRPLFALDAGPWHLVATDAGLVRFLSILARSWLAVQAAVLLTATTSFPDLLHALRHLGLPRALVAVVAFMYRYLFVLADEALRLLRAREARSARLPGVRAGGSLAWRARVAGSMAGQLFLRSYERSDRIYQAMLARGYAGHLLTLNPHVLRGRDWLFGALAVVALLALQLVARLRL